MKRLLLLATFALLIPAEGAFAAHDGRALHEQNCGSCHGAEVYTRADRRVTSRAALAKQVRRCELALGLRWFDDQIEAVADHLNQRHYHF